VPLTYALITRRNSQRHSDHRFAGTDQHVYRDTDNRHLPVKANAVIFPSLSNTLSLRICWIALFQKREIKFSSIKILRSASLYASALIFFVRTSSVPLPQLFGKLRLRCIDPNSPNLRKAQSTQRAEPWKPWKSEQSGRSPPHYCGPNGARVSRPGIRARSHEPQPPGRKPLSPSCWAT